MGRDTKGIFPMITALFARSSSTVEPVRATSAASDEALVRRIADGDRLAMHTLFARHQTRVFRWLLRLLDNEATAEDLLSEVFLDVWRQAGRFEARSSVSTWLMSIARFKALSVRRRRHDAELTDTIVSTIADPADDPETVADASSRGRLLLRALEKLSPQHREVVDLVYYHEKSVDEVARIIEVPVGTVKTRMFYARKQLAEEMARHLHQPTQLCELS
jgi:RNA polymerase sigma-70 factor (ECF subfamily)